MVFLSKVMRILNFKNKKFKVDYYRQNGSKNQSINKASQPRGNLVVFSKKNVIKNNDFSIKNMKKHEKYLKSKNDVKKLLGAFNQEL